MPDQLSLLEKFTYDSEIPSCLRSKPSTRLKNGRPLGSVSETSPYYRVSFRDEEWMAHRVIWVMHYGAIPEGFQIDHVDGNRINNRIENLRLVSPKMNSRNKKKRATSSTGHAGISFYNNGIGNEYFVFEWTNMAGVKQRKHFSCSKLGHDAAKQAAVEYKKSLSERLLEDGYTKRHIGEN